MVRTWCRISPRRVGPTSRWARRSIWKSSCARSPTRITRCVGDSASLAWSGSSELDIGLFARQHHSSRKDSDPLENALSLSIPVSSPPSPLTDGPAMLDTPLFTRLLDLPRPWRVDSVSLDTDQQRIDVGLAHRPNAAFRCPECGH